MRTRMIIVRTKGKEADEAVEDYKKEVRIEGKVTTHHGGEHKAEFSLPYEQAANALMSAEGFIAYVNKHGYHFTEELAEHVSGMMENASGSTHTWSASQVEAAMSKLGYELPANVTLGDATYLANMYYADFYPSPLADEASCLKAAYRAATDSDGYEGVAFCRWTADAIGKAVYIDWDKFI